MRGSAQHGMGPAPPLRARRPTSTPSARTGPAPGHELAVTSRAAPGPLAGGKGEKRASFDMGGSIVAALDMPTIAYDKVSLPSPPRVPC